MDGNSSHFSFKRGGIGRARKHAAYVVGADRYASREDVVHTSSGNMPAWAADDPLVFWNAADQHERANGRAYHEFEFAIPRELSQDDATKLIKGWIGAQLGKRHPWTYGVHLKLAEDGHPNIHCHLMFSDRLLDGVERQPELFFKRPASRYRDKKTGELRDSDPARGGAGKDRRWNDRLLVKNLRTDWQKYANEFLAEHGHRPRLDLRSNAERGLGNPEPKIGPEKRRGDHWRNGRQQTVVAQRQARRKARAEFHAVKRELQAARRERARRDACTCQDGNSAGRQERPYRSPLSAMQPEQRIGRSVYRWSSGVAMGLAAIIDRGDKLSLCGKASMQKVRAVIELSKAKGWRSLVLTGPDEFKRLAVREALREGLRVTNPELADLVAQILKEQEMQMQDHQGKNNERMEQARRWLATAAPVNALEAAVLNKDADRLLRLFDSHPEAQRWQMIEHQRTQGIPESLLGFEIEDKNAAGAFEATVRHVGKRVWVEPKNRPGVVVPVIPSEHQRVRPGQRIAIQADGRIALMPERDLAPRPN